MEDKIVRDDKPITIFGLLEGRVPYFEIDEIVADISKYFVGKKEVVENNKKILEQVKLIVSFIYRKNIDSNIKNAVNEIKKIVGVNDDES